MSLVESRVVDINIDLNAMSRLRYDAICKSIKINQVAPSRLQCQNETQNDVATTHGDEPALCETETCNIDWTICRC